MHEQEHGFALYTFSFCERMNGTARWRDDDTGFDVYGTFDEAKAAVLELRRMFAIDVKQPLEPIQIEKLTLCPIDRSVLITLLNDGMEPLVVEHEILEVIA